MPQVTFTRINPVGPAHALRDDELQTATNIDLSFGQGALIPRRGSTVFGTVTAGQSLGQIFRNYNLPDNIGGNSFYVTDGAGSVYRGSAGSWTKIVNGGHADISGINSFGTYAIIASGAQYFKDDGTNCTEWIKQSPGTPTVVVQTLAPLVPTGTFSSQIHGTSITAGSTGTADTDANFNINFEINYGSAQDFNTNSGHTIGDFGVHFVDLAFSDPGAVVSITQLWSIGDLTYSNYFRAKAVPGQIVPDSAQADPNILIDSQLSIPGSSSIPLTQDDRERMIAAIRSNNRSAVSIPVKVTTGFNPWAVARPDFDFVGRSNDVAGTEMWTNILGIYWAIECSGTCTATIRSCSIDGSQDYPLTDLDVGYAWWQTFATLDASGNKIGESAPSPSSTRIKMQNSQAKVTYAGGPSGGAHGITHLITYRQGGYTRDAYAVNTISIGVANYGTVTDSLNDIQALSINMPMLRNIYSPSDFPGNVVTIAEPWAERVFFGETNNLRWSLPGQVDAIPKTSRVRVSNIGDNLKAIIPWPPGLVLVNQYSVFEFTGSDLENGDFLVQRSGSKHGSVAPRVPIRTPHGIPLLHYDGLTMYIPGQGIDSEIPWLINDYGDMFRGAGASDPAALKGSRIPAINRSHIDLSCAAYTDGKLYLACATGSDAVPRTIYVIDFSTKQCWWYYYNNIPGIRSLFWDHQDSRLFAGTSDGRIMQLETGTLDANTVGGTTGIVPWNALSKAWSVVTENILENVFVEAKYFGTPGALLMNADMDGGGVAIGTFTTLGRSWSNFPLNGTFNNFIDFSFFGFAGGTSTTEIYQLNFDLLPQPPRVQYYRANFETKGYEGDKLWDVGYYDLALRGTVLANSVQAVTFIDGVAVMTTTCIATNTERHIFEQSFPPETYGRVAYTTYTILPGAIPFQIYATQYDARPEPPKVNYWRTDIQSLDENICDGYDVDINPNGTVTSTCFVDNVAVATDTIIGTKRQSYSNGLGRELYGRTIYAQYTGTGLKHYKTWWDLRHEPDRTDTFVCDKKSSGQEMEWKVFKPEINPLGATVLATVTADVEGVALQLSTHTITGNERLQYTFSLPVRTFARTIWAGYQVQGGGVFKHYSTDFDGDPEPARVTSYRTGPTPFPSSNYLKTWLPHLDCLGNTILGTLIVDDVALTTGTFTGTAQQWYTVGLDLSGANALQTGSRWEAVYNSSGPGSRFKHYETKLESEAKPFGKPSWAYSYRKLGGTSQIDMVRYLSLELEGTPGSTCTYFIDINGTQFTTSTVVLGTGPTWYDRLPVPPGARGYLFQVRLRCPSNFKPYKVNLDLAQEGIKHLVRRESHGTPQSPSEPHA